MHGARRRAEEVGTVVVDVARHASVGRAVGRRDWTGERESPGREAEACGVLKGTEGGRAGGLWCLHVEGREGTCKRRECIGFKRLPCDVVSECLTFCSFQIKLVATVEDYIYNVKVVAGCTLTTHFHSH